MIGVWMTALAIAAAPTCQVRAVDFHGWKAHEIANPWVRLTIVPQLGGRLMQVTFGDHDFLFVNDQLKGQAFTPETSLAQRKWFNYGGDKIWPMPEGEEHHRLSTALVGAVGVAVRRRRSEKSNGLESRLLGHRPRQSTQRVSER